MAYIDLNAIKKKLGDCMNNSAGIFSEYLKKEDINVNEFQDENFYIFSFDATIEAGPTANIVCFFDENTKADWTLTIEALNYVKIDNPMKKEYILEKLNELNRKYNFVKFILSEEGAVFLKIYYNYYDNFNPEKLLEMVFHIYDVLKDEYKGFMKIIWG
mgnify:CR=1 FL=1